MDFPSYSTPFPSRLLDEIMPTLKDTEWRLLCVVVRQTLGWREGSGRKKRDWLTHAQLKAHTGRSSEAVSQAVNALVKKMLIETCDEEGILLKTPEDRRACAGRLYFRLGAKAIPERGLLRKTETHLPISERHVSQSEDAKSKTTKERSDKTITHAEAGSRFSAEAKDATRFLQGYMQRFRQRSARGEPPPIRWERDLRLAEELLSQYGYARLSGLLERFFESKDPRVKKRGYALSCFPVLLPALLMEETFRTPDQGRTTTMPVVVHGPSAEYVRAVGQKVRSASLFARYPELAQRVRTPP